MFGLIEATSGHLGTISGPSWAVWALLGAFQGPSWSHHGPSWRHLGRLGALLEPSWGLLEPREGPLGAILGPLGQKHENDPKKGPRISPALIDFWDHFGVIFWSFSGSVFELILNQFLDQFWDHFGLIFGSKLAPKVDHFYKAFWEPFWSHLESRLGPPGALLRGLMFQKHCKNRVQMHVRKNASWPRVTSPGPPSRANLGSSLAAFELQNGTKIAKKHCTKNDSIFDQFLTKFFTSFGIIFGPQTEPRIHPKTGPEMDPKRAPRAKCPNMAASVPLCSNLLFLTHSNDLLKSVKPSLRS